MFEIALRNFFSKPLTKKNLWLDQKKSNRAKGSIKADIGRCNFCGICEKTCISNAIKVNLRGKEWEINHFKCVSCGECVRLCPQKCIYMDTQEKMPAYDKSEERLSRN